MPEQPFTDADLPAVKVLIAHQRRDIGSCICGWGVDTGDLGRDHSLHVWRELQRAALPAHDARIRARAGEDAARALEAAGRDPLQNLAWMYPQQAARIVREVTGATGEQVDGG
jgi:hypothetical protein